MADSVRGKADILARLSNDYASHPHNPGQAERYEAITSEAHAFARKLVGYCPTSRELSIALTHIEQAAMYANSAIARGEPPPSSREA